MKKTILWIFLVLVGLIIIYYCLEISTVFKDKTTKDKAEEIVVGDTTSEK